MPVRSPAVPDLSAVTAGGNEAVCRSVCVCVSPRAAGRGGAQSPQGATLGAPLAPLHLPGPGSCAP